MGSCKEVITPGVKEVSSSSEPAWFERQVKKNEDPEGPIYGAGLFRTDPGERVLPSRDA